MVKLLERMDCDSFISVYFKCTVSHTSHPADLCYMSEMGNISHTYWLLKTLKLETFSGEICFPPQVIFHSFKNLQVGSVRLLTNKKEMQVYVN